MRLQPTLEKLTTMRFSGIAKALEAQRNMNGLEETGFEDMSLPTPFHLS